ncbi:hypothetical protein BB561_001050 [Smittium simulii]|uniref:Swi5-dependent recombination DNA repair protein 1 homolog n=1 Tax=Smittium simulii TaxID=133385 RepID=A0A2T9YWE6_9FUNG|nr:hypothetical protein BB561_001050 [Smittium simulii]
MRRQSNSKGTPKFKSPLKPYCIPPNSAPKDKSIRQITSVTPKDKQHEPTLEESSDYSSLNKPDNIPKISLTNNTPTFKQTKKKSSLEPDLFSLNVPSDLFQLEKAESNQVLALRLKKKTLNAELKKAKDDISLFQTAVNILENNKSEKVEKLIVKWRNALVSSSENLFNIVEPSLKTQYELEKEKRASGNLANNNPDFSDIPEDQSFEIAHTSSQESSTLENETLYDFMIKSMGIDAKLLLS